MIILREPNLVNVRHVSRCECHSLRPLTVGEVVIFRRKCRHTSFASASLLWARLRCGVQLNHRLRLLLSRLSSAAAPTRSLVGDFIGVFVFVAMLLPFFISCKFQRHINIGKLVDYTKCDASVCATLRRRSLCVRTRFPTDT